MKLDSAPHAGQNWRARVPRAAGSGWLTSIQHAAMHATAGHGVAIALTLAIVSAAIGLDAFSNRLRATALLASMVLALGYWLLGEGLGGVFTGSATDTNSGPLLVLFAVALHRAAKMPSADRAAGGLLPLGPAISGSYSRGPAGEDRRGNVDDQAPLD